MTTLTAKTIVVVGASGVLGSDLARKLVESGARVIGLVHAESSLAHAPAGLAACFVCDLTRPASIDEAASRVAEFSPVVDGLVLAAGVVAFGAAADTPPSVTSELMAVNATGPMHLVHALLPLMTKSEDAFIVSLSGIVSEMPVANLAAYSASKSALHAFAAAASRELRRAQIRWIDARPGHTETGLAGRAIFGQAPVFPAGMSPDAVTDRLLSAIVNDERDLPSSAFPAAP